MNRLATRASRAIGARLAGAAVASGAALHRSLRPLATAERTLPVAVASIVAVAALLAFLPMTPQGAVGGVQGSGAEVRLAVNGGIQRVDPGRSALSESGLAPADVTVVDQTERAEVNPGMAGPFGGPDSTFLPVVLPGAAQEQAGAQEQPLDGAVLGDGTIITGYAPLTAVEDGADLIKTYKVKQGDTLASIAKQHKVSMMTLWWANKLKTKESLKVGQTLRIPPVSGLVYTVKATDTLETLAATHKIKAERIVELNGLEDPTLVVGQVLVLPGAKGAPMPTPTPKPTPKPATSSSGSGSVSGPAKYAGGAFRWPVVGGGNYISQYFRYSHFGLDIAATYGTKVVAATGGRVIFAGWKSNGGGYQVWISHGSGLYTTYNHMDSVSVSRGQTVGRGQQVGLVGSSGNSTGSHLHFEVWKGPVWSGGTRVNPLRYY